MTVAALPIAASDVRAMVSGGAEAMQELTRRIASGSGDMSAELFQIGDAATVHAFQSRVAKGGSLELLADARLPKGGFDREMRGAASHYTEYAAGADNWQHAKNYHFQDTGDGPESLISNLAPIAKSFHRTELGLFVVGDAAEAAQEVARAAMSGDRAATAGAIDRAAQYGVLYNDPWANRFTLDDEIYEILEPSARDKLVITKGIDHIPTSRKLVAADQRADVKVFVRDIAQADANLLAAHDVPTWAVGGGLQPRVNAYFDGDERTGIQGVLTTAFLWGNMIGGPGRTTSRDAGVLLTGEQALQVRRAALETILAMPDHTPIGEVTASVLLPDHI